MTSRRIARLVTALVAVLAAGLISAPPAQADPGVTPNPIDLGETTPGGKTAVLTVAVEVSPGYKLTSVSQSGFVNVLGASVDIEDCDATTTSLCSFTISAVPGALGGFSLTLHIGECQVSNRTCRLLTNVLVSGVAKRPTSTDVTCAPATASPAQPMTCTAKVLDTGGGNPPPPSGAVGFSSSASGSFSASACTLVNGSCSVTYTPAAPGDHTVTASYDGSATSLKSSDNFVTTVKLSQAIDTSQLPTSAFVGLSFPLNAYGGGSGNPVTWSSATPAVCTVTPTGTPTYLKAGICTLAMTQSGNATYWPGTATRSFQVFGFGFYRLANAMPPTSSASAAIDTIRM